MKRILIFLLGVMMCLSCASCEDVSDGVVSESDVEQTSSETVESESSTTSSTQESDVEDESSIIEESSNSDSSDTVSSEEPETINKGYEFEVIRCVFTDKILPSEFELCERYYEAPEGCVMVDLALRFKNNLDNFEFTKHSFKGSITCELVVLEMDILIENSCNFADTDTLLALNTISSHEETVVHFTAVLEESYKDKEAEITYTIAGEAYTAKVSPYVPTQPKLEDKMKLEIGQEHTSCVDFVPYTITVNDAYIAETFSASGSSATYYEYEDADAFVVVATIKNNSSSSQLKLYLAEAYCELNGEFIMAENKIESANKMTLNPFEAYITNINAGESAVVYFTVPVPKGSSTSDGYAMRINLGNQCFYYAF